MLVNKYLAVEYAPSSGKYYMQFQLVTLVRTVDNMRMYIKPGRYVAEFINGKIISLLKAY